MGTSAPKHVFISYARRTSSAAAQALHRALGPRVAFLDTSDIEHEEAFPARIAQALLDARVFVALAEDVYFERWYCGKEWSLALAASEAVRERGGSAGEVEAEFSRLILLRPDEGPSETARDQLPPHLAWKNLCPASDTARAAELVRKRLAASPTTFRQRLKELGVLHRVLEHFAGETRIPPARTLDGRPSYPAVLPPSLQDRFVGRDEDLWRLHHRLVRPGHAASLASVTAALHGGAGFGKTQLAREYLWRYGPLHYEGGVFWMDATGTSAPVRRQQYEIARALGRKLPPWEKVRSALDVAGELALALRAIPQGKRLLVVVDNVPERGGGQASAALQDYCPELSRATVLATSRAGVYGAAQVSVDVLTRAGAIALLRAQRSGDALSPQEWEAVAEWVGRLPLALELLRACMDHQAIEPRALLAKARRPAGALVQVDSLHAALQGVVPPGALRGIAQSFDVTYDALGPQAQAAARALAWLQPAPVPDVLLDAACEGLGGRATRALLLSRSVLASAAGAAGRASPSHAMHRLLVEYLRARCRPDGDEPERAFRCLEGLYSRHARADRTALQLRLACLPAIGAWVESGGGLPTEAQGLLMALEDRLDRLWRATALREPLEARVAVARRAVQLANAAGGVWAAPQNTLGLALTDQAGASEGAERARLLGEAVTAYREALKLHTRKSLPQGWAATQNNLGNALSAQAGASEGTERARLLGEAVTAYREALKVYTRKALPQGWAMTQNNLGTALRAQAEASEGAERARLRGEAVTAYREALKVYTRKALPQGWAGTQNNLGNALSAQAGASEGTERARLLGEAVTAYGEALKVYTRKALPQGWAMTQNNLGTALSAQAGASEGTERARLLGEAVTAYRQALKVYTRKSLPQGWATTQNNLGNALRAQVGASEGTERARLLGEAVTAYGEALKVYTRKSLPQGWATTQNNLGTALIAQAVASEGAERARLLGEAVTAYREALKVRTRKALPQDWALTQWNLALALRTAAGGARGADWWRRLQDAVASMRAALTVFTPDAAPADNARGRAWIAALVSQLAGRP